MALTLGTNCGFVTSAPTADPSGTNIQVSNIEVGYGFVLKHTTPAGATKITEIGWYCDNATAAANYEVGLYSANGAVVPGEAGTLLYVSRTNAKGTGAGWKKVTVDWDISASTSYHIGLQVDPNGASTTNGNYTAASESCELDIKEMYTLPNPFGGGAYSNSGDKFAIYALVTVASNIGKINIGDTWKTASAVKINIGDSWKTVTHAKINIGDTWKTVF